MESAPRVMVVDDEATICQNVEKILKKHNYEVTCASSAQEALDKMAQESYALLISDIVMPGMNGLELLKLVKEEWPLTKAVMMTAYASTDTAVNAIRLGALDYIPKPFTPDELRGTVDMAVTGQLEEAPISAEERAKIDPIDVDLPFDAKDVADVTGEAYVDSLGPSGMPVVEVRMPDDLEGYCEVGAMVCDIFKKLGATCKAGTKTSECPQLKKKKAAKSAGKKTDVRTLVGIDQPFNYDEVAAVTGPEYIRNLHNEGVSVPTYEELKANVARLTDAPRSQIDADIPFDAREVAEVTGEDYVRQLGPSDQPVVEITAAEPLEGFCETGAMVCDIFKKLGATCKAGTKTGACPQLKKKAAKKAADAVAFDPGRHIGPDMPFDYREVAAATGPEYVEHLVYDGTVQMPYEALKARMAETLQAPAEDRTPTEVIAFPDAPHTRPILVIDDEAAVNNNIRKVLAKKGFHVDQALTKAEALEKIDDHAYRLILLDLKIPGVQGLELLEQIRNRQPDAQVIMITGYASIETAVEAARMGVVSYLPKPFTPEEIRSAAEAALKIAA